MRNMLLNCKRIDISEHNSTKNDVIVIFKDRLPT